jgi:hypothetical protein
MFLTLGSSEFQGFAKERLEFLETKMRYGGRVLLPFIQM